MKIYDSDIRCLLFSKFKEIDEFTSADDTVVINELDICNGVSRADIAVVNGKLHGYEIKSQQDNLERLPLQMESYNLVFDTMTVVAFESHIEKIKHIVPSWWGIKCVTQRNGHIKLKNIRKGKINKNINIHCLAQLLWKEEMIELLQTYGNAQKGYKNKSRYELSTIIEREINYFTVKDYVRETLKSRVEWKAVPLQRLNGDLHNTKPN